MTRLQLRCSPDQKERWMAAAGGDGNLSEWIRDTLDREAEKPGGTPGRTRWIGPLGDGAVEEGPDGKALGETPDEATAQVAPDGSSSTVEEDAVGTSGEAEPDPPLPGEPGGSSSTLTEEGGVNQSSSGDHGQEMSPLSSGENDRSSRTSASTSPPAVSAAVPAPIQAASLDIVVQRLFPGVKTEDLTAEYESTEHEFNDFLGWLTWRHERDESTRIVDEAVYGFSVTKNGERIDPASIEAYDPDDDTNPEPEDPVDLEPPRMLEAEQHQRPTLSPVCVNAAMHWKLVAGETCRYCGGTL
jgi:hypothetical protein